VYGKIAKSKRDALKRMAKKIQRHYESTYHKRSELPTQTALFVSNHISWLDIIVIGQYLPLILSPRAIFKLAGHRVLSQQAALFYP